MHQETYLMAGSLRSLREDSIFNLRLGDVGWLLLFNALAFQVFFQEEIGGILNYIDEASSLIVLIATVASTRHGGKTSDVVPLATRWLLILLLALAIIIGIASNIASGICNDVYPILVDAFTFCKVPIVLLCCLSVLQGCDGGSRSAWKILVHESQILIAIMFLCAAVNIASNGNVLNMGGEIRYGIPSFGFVFYHPEVVNLLLVGLMVILLVDDPRGHKVALIAVLLVMCATLRWKAIGFAAVAFYMFFLAGKGGLSPAKVLVIIAIAVLVAWGQISTYYDTDSTARSMLTSDSFDIARRFAPLGSGFGTFGSAVTAGVTYYSPLYYQYDYETVYGLSPVTPSYISDTFWPTIIAQLGFVGGALYFMSVVLLFWLVYKRCKEMGAGTAVVVVIIYLAISSTSASALFAPQWVFISFVLFLSLRLKRSTVRFDETSEQTSSVSCNV